MSGVSMHRDCLATAPTDAAGDIESLWRWLTVWSLQKTYPIRAVFAIKLIIRRAGGL